LGILINEPIQGAPLSSDIPVFHLSRQWQPGSSIHSRGKIGPIVASTTSLSAVPEPFPSITSPLGHFEAYGEDVSSSNEVPQEILNALSLAGDAGETRLRLANLLIAGPAGTSLSAPIGDLIRDYAPEELRHMNRDTLHAMAIDDALIEAFLAHPWYSSRYETILVHALGDMEGVLHRGRFLEVAMTAESGEEALFFQQLAEMLRAYHRHVIPLTELVVIDTHLIVGYTKERHLTAMLPIAHLPWRQDVEQAAKALSTWDSPGHEVEQIEVWLVGRSSPRAFSHLLTKGFTIHEEANARLHLTLLQNETASAQSPNTIPEPPPPISLSKGASGKRAPAPAIERSRRFQEAELQKETKTTALAGDDERLRPEEQFQLSIGRALLTMTGALNVKLAFENNFNLRTTKQRDELAVNPQTNLDFVLAFPQGFSLFTEFSLSDEINFENSKKPENTFQFRLRDAFVHLPIPVAFPSALRVGRQQIFEPRRWVFSQRFDAVKLLLDPEPFHFWLAVTTSIPSSGKRKRVFDDIFVARDQVDFIVNSSFDLTDKSVVSQYLIFGSKHENLIKSGDPLEEDPVWVGLRVFGLEKFNTKYKWLKFDFLEDLFRPKIRYWLDMAYVTGTVKDKNLSGFGLDVGVSYIARKFPLLPYVTVAYAFGSGDRNPNDGVDRNFRQTGAQGNSGKFGGVVNFDYYGVLNDPELSNLHVYTAGIGIRPWPKGSVDLVYHRYRQDVALNKFRDANVEDPQGKNTDIGEEIDVIFGYREIQNLRFRLRTGYFFPGDAYSKGKDDPAFLAKFDAQFSF